MTEYLTLLIIRIFLYLTPESYNGNPIIKGENEDNLGLVLGKYWKGIIYKIILYSKTISLLEINFLKNLMEKDEIIDINHPIFISNTEDENNAHKILKLVYILIGIFLVLTYTLNLIFKDLKL